MFNARIWIKNTFPQFYAKLRVSKLRNIYCYKHIRWLKNCRLAVQNYGYHVIGRVTSYSEEHNFAIWIEAGTLLGYVREGRLLAYDYDLDFGMLELSKKDRSMLIDDFAAMGFEWVRSGKDSTRVYSDTFDYKGVDFDIKYYFKEKNYLYRLEYAEVDKRTVIKTQKEGKNKIKYAVGFDIYKYIMSDTEFIKSEFLNGCACIIPKNPVKRVEEMYGINWKIPIKDEYVWFRDTENEYLGFQSDVKVWNKK